MPKKRLTEMGVDRLRPPATGTLDYYDAGMPGLVLRVNYGGAKIWRALYYLKRLDQDGRRVTIPTTHKLGRYPVLKLNEAREKARSFLADPQKALARVETGSFRQIAENFFKRHVEHEGLRTAYQVKRNFEKYVFPRWGDRQLRDIKRSDVAILLDQIVDNHGARMADVVLANVRKLMNWYAARDDDFLSPIVQGMNRNNNSKRTRVLTDDEIRALWKVTDDLGMYGALLKVALLTAQRRDKVATMKWDDIVDGVWNIPTEKREKSNAGSLKLPEMVLDIIDKQPRLAGNPHVFSAGRGNGPFKQFSRSKEEIDKKLRVPDWVIHDLRRTAKTLMARAEVRPDISERVLGHTIKGVEGVYDQHGYDNEKADALSRLAAEVQRILNPPPKAKVIKLKRRAR